MMQGRPLRPALRRSPQKASRSTPASRRRTGDSSEAEVWLHLIKPITAGLIDAPRLKLMRRLRDGAALRFRLV
ncbi:MAG: hypothetical protein AUG47_01575 [Alphaproteobacteria bacterium 13_1_20CM_3_64_12]|nr:MAG: hypothetical protein AUG47_01575 [Alphaproteobacteria bacterium 13_1_20CM_3_64_12]